MEVFLHITLCLLSILFTVSLAQAQLPFPFNLFGGGDTDYVEPFRAVKSNDLPTLYTGGWELHSQNSKVSSMHLILMPNRNKAVIFDATVFGPSLIRLPNGICRPVPIRRKGEKKSVDCFAHSVEYDLDTAEVRPLMVLTDTWCSSGGLSANGTLVQTGGWNDGGNAVRYLRGCANCDWQENQGALTGQRWYSTQQILPDGSFIVVGGRRMFSYEFVPAEGQKNTINYKLPLLRETTDNVENNLYPFVHLSTDGNLFILANNRSILLNPITKTVIREFPVLAGGSRNYPASGMSALLPIKLHGVNAKVIPAEVMVCGGAKYEAAKLAEKGIFLPAIQNCGRLQITLPNPEWKMETMPTPRVMGDMLNLPTGDILLINGAKKGTSGWLFAEDPSLSPVLYSPMKSAYRRFTTLTASTIPRMYHSTSAVLPDGKILVAGSNTNNVYKFKDVKYPTELRIEKFWPPYLDPLLAVHRPTILTSFTRQTLNYGQNFDVAFTLADPFVTRPNMKVTMYAPPFTTHGFSMNQRLIELAITYIKHGLTDTKTVSAITPPSSKVAPPGYYIMFVVFRGVPSKGVWIKIG